MKRDSESPGRTSAILLIVLLLLQPLLFEADQRPTDNLEAKMSQHSSGYVNGSVDATMKENAPGDNFGSSSNLTIGGSVGGEQRIVFKFPLTQSAGGLLPSTNTLQSATLQLVCSRTSGASDLLMHPSLIFKEIDEATVSWTEHSAALPWSTPGAEGSDDRGVWDKPSFMAGNGTINLNVTALAQQSLRDGNSNMSIMVVATLGTTYTCASKEHNTTSSRPVLNLSWTTNSPPGTATLNRDSPLNGSAVMEDSFLLSPDLTPSLDWSSLSGNGVETQISDSPVFRSSTNVDRCWTSWEDNSLFSQNGQSGSVTLPASANLVEGDVVHYRVRGVNQTEIGEWYSGWFILPAPDVMDNGDGSATFTIRRGELGSQIDSAEETHLRSGSPSAAAGSSSMIGVGHSSTSTLGEMNALLRFHLENSGLHSNATIINATIVLNRTSVNGDVIVANRLVTQNGWIESSATWNTYDGVSTWDELGAIGPNDVSASHGAVNGSAGGSELRIDSTNAAQRYHRNLVFGQAISFLLTSNAANNENIWFDSSEATCGDCRPGLEVTYRWNTNSTPSDITQNSPAAGATVWEDNNHNLSGDTTPVLGWNLTDSAGREVIVELSQDPEFLSTPTLRADSRYDSGFNLTGGTFTVPSNWSIDTGLHYYWRVQWVEGDERGNLTPIRNFYVTSLSSWYVGGNTWEYILREGNDSVDGNLPYCPDTFIDSYYPDANYFEEGELHIGESGAGTHSVALIGCELEHFLLPDGYAISEAHLRLEVIAYYTSTVDVYESNQHNWTDEGANWNTYDGVNNWSASGANGSERGQKIGSASVNAYGDIDLNVTLAVQNAFREERRVDFILDRPDSASGTLNYFHTYDSSRNPTSRRPELVLRYMVGSDDTPTPPQLNHPTNGEWMVEDGIRPMPISRPQFSWVYGNNTPVNGWEVQADTSSTFSSSDLLSWKSWSDSGFDLTNHTFQPANNLTSGKIWSWRVRAYTPTYQIGGWSWAESFRLPDITTRLVSNDTSEVEIRHMGALPNEQLPLFTDNWVAGNGTESSNSHHIDQQLIIGLGSAGEGNRAGLIRIPLLEVPYPSDARVVSATLHLYPSSTTNSPRLSVHQSLRNWTESANGTTYDGSNPWNQSAGFGDGDYGELLDVAPVTNAQWLELNVTKAVQNMLAVGESNLSLFLRADTDTPSEVRISSTESSWTAGRPWLTLTWREGNGTLPIGTASNLDPSENAIVWTNSTHALTPNRSPTLSWSHPDAANATNWRLILLDDPTDEREGYTIKDSRTDAGFDVVNLTWTSTTQLAPGSSHAWRIQPIRDDMLGNISDMAIFHVPNQVGGEVNSTDAWVEFQQGNAVPVLGTPQLSIDSWLDKRCQSSSESDVNHGNEESMFVSYLANQIWACNPKEISVIRLNISSLPIPQPNGVVSAHLRLHADTNITNYPVAIHPLLRDWVESEVTANEFATGQSWEEIGGLGVNDSGAWEDIVIINGGGWYDWDITSTVQAASSAGQNMVSFLLTSEIDSSNQHVSVEFHTSEHNETSYRPILNMTYRNLVTQWVPPTSSNHTPLDGGVAWEMSTSRPAPANPVVLEWNHPSPANLSWQLQLSDDPLFYELISNMVSTNSSTHNGTFAAGGSNYTFPPGMNWADEWYLWRVRPIQDGRYGAWSQINSFRVPQPPSSPYWGDDGQGNHTVTLWRGAIFDETSPLMPLVPDAIASQSPGGNGNVNRGSDLQMDLPRTDAGRESAAYITFDVSDIPFPTNMVTTRALLQLHRESVTTYQPSGASVSISATSCSSFIEDTLTWNNQPTCNSTELDRVTIQHGISSGTAATSDWYEWDITGYAHQAITVGGNITIRLDTPNWQLPPARHQFTSSESSNYSLRPKLVLQYVDNTEGITPPTAPLLLTPTDREMLYEPNGWMVQPQLRPTLTWAPVADSTGYIVLIENETHSFTFENWSDAGFLGTSYQLQFDLVQGETYEWRVQALNGSLPGPYSAKSSFAPGRPFMHQAHNSQLFTYGFRQGGELSSWSLPEVSDGWIGEGNPEMSHGSSELVVGDGCDSMSMSDGYSCFGLIQVDFNQVPLPTQTEVHSAALGLKVIQRFTDSPMAMRITAYLVNSNNWVEAESNWNDSASGVPWSTSGLQSGVDYQAIPLGWGVLDGTISDDEFLWIDIGDSRLDVNGTHTILLKGTPIGTQGHINAQFYGGEDSTIGNRPVILLNYTTVNQVQVNPTPMTTLTNADTPVQFDAQLYLVGGSSTTGPLTWHTTDGVIDSSGFFTPEHVGNITITACYGAVCGDFEIEVVPGSPTTLVASPLSGIITSDESLQLEAKVLDQWDNVVAGETVTWQVTNGSVNETQVYLPWQVGNQTITAQWGGQQVDILVEVLVGQPHHFTLDSDVSIPAGTSHQFNWTLHDAKENPLPVEEEGTLSWWTEQGNVTENGTYTADWVGNWTVWMSSDNGAFGEAVVNVTDGTIFELEISPSTLTLTSDELLLLTTTRIDVRGNRLRVNLPLESWTWSNGSMIAGDPAVWVPWRKGPQWIEAELEGESTRISVSVLHGVVNWLELEADRLNMTADGTAVTTAWAHDQHGNRWCAGLTVTWTILEEDAGHWLSVYPEECKVVFEAATVGDWSLRGSHLADINGSITEFRSELVFHVTPGMLQTVTISGDGEEMTADEELYLDPKVRDADGNLLPNDLLEWFVDGKDVTELFRNSSYIFNASNIGDHVIEAVHPRDSALITVNVTHGLPVELVELYSTATLVANDYLQFSIQGTDSDGNEFPWAVDWFTYEGGVFPREVVGDYEFWSTKAGKWLLNYSSLGVTGSWEVTVLAGPLYEFNITLERDSAKQQETIHMLLDAYDEYRNPIPIPDRIVVVSTAGEVEVINSREYVIELVVAGSNSVTVEKDGVEATAEFEVELTFAGFFAEGGPMYYAGGIGGALLAFIILVLVLMKLIRKGDDDDDDFEGHEISPSDEALPNLGSYSESMESSPPGPMGGSPPGPMGGSPPGPMGGSPPGRMGGSPPGPMGGSPPGPMGGSPPGRMGGSPPGPGKKSSATRLVSQDDSDDYSRESGTSRSGSGQRTAPPALKKRRTTTRKQEQEARPSESYNVDEDGVEWWEDEYQQWWYRGPYDQDWQQW